MTRLCVLALAVGGGAFAQDVFETGAAVFRQTCAQGYCHGAAGAQGRAPRLIGRQYEQAAAAKIIREGVPNTGMPGFANRLSSAQLEAVTAYVVKISGGTYTAGAVTASTQSAPMPPEARRGKDLFFDAGRGVHRCGTCHMLEGMGTAIGPNLATTPAVSDAVTIAAIRRGRGAGIRLAQIQGLAPFPALVLDQRDGLIRLFDLSAVPPVLRTLAKDEVILSGGAAWPHSEAVKNYTDAELQSVAAYLRWLALQ